MSTERGSTSTASSLFTKLATGLDVSALNAQIDAHPELWNSVNYRKATPGSPHGEMSDIWVRYNDIRPYAALGDYSRMKDAHIPIWYPAWYALPALRPIVFGIMAALEGEMLGAIFITKIPHGCGIAPHQDGGWHVDYYEKVYVALKAAPGAEFHSVHPAGGTETLCPEVGDVHLFDNHQTHWVTNDSGQDRMTLIVCVRTDRWRSYAQQSHTPVSYSRDAPIPDGMARLAP